MFFLSWLVRLTILYNHCKWFGRNLQQQQKKNSECRIMNQSKNEPLKSCLNAYKRTKKKFHFYVIVCLSYQQHAFFPVQSIKQTKYNLPKRKREEDEKRIKSINSHKRFGNVFTHLHSSDNSKRNFFRLFYVIFRLAFAVHTEICLSILYSYSQRITSNSNQRNKYQTKFCCRMYPTPYDWIV